MSGLSKYQVTHATIISLLVTSVLTLNHYVHMPILVVHADVGLQIPSIQKEDKDISLIFLKEKHISKSW